jgi:hypothetical protein
MKAAAMSNNFMKHTARSFLELVARFAPSNKLYGRELYPQLWYCWPRWAGRRNPRIFRVRTWLCGKLTGHELSRTEWGYGGGKFVNMNCRWCDKAFSIPLSESMRPESLPAINSEPESGGGEPATAKGGEE